MNRKTDIDATLNPCSAEMDKHTYGCKWLNVSIHGKRLIRIGVLGVNLDIYRVKRLPGMRRFIYARYGNGAFFGFPFGSISWPMPQSVPTEQSTGGEG